MIICQSGELSDTATVITHLDPIRSNRRTENLVDASMRRVEIVRMHRVANERSVIIRVPAWM